MIPLFINRVDAARQLVRPLRYLAHTPNLIILGLPRGGVPIAAEVARALGGRLDVFVVRKLGVPGQPELAMGALASGGVQILNRELIAMVGGLSTQVLEAVIEREQAELARRELLYRGHRPLLPLEGATVVLVDDGVATGSTMLAALRAVRAQHPATLIAAAPVMSREAQDAIAREADQCVTVATPEPFYGVGAWYRDFSQLADADVLALLDQSQAAHPLEVNHAAGG